MKRILKNVVMIIITLVSISGLIFTCIYFNKDNSNNMSGGTPPNMQGNGNMGSSDNTPPDKPSGESKDNTPPEKPSGDDANKSTPPEKPAGENNDMGNNQSMKAPEAINQTSNNKVWFYVIVVSLSLLIAINIGYLIISGFNAKTFKETFGIADKTIIFVLLTIIITAVLSLTSIWFNGTNSQNSQPNNGNMNESMNNKTPSYSSSNEITSDKTISDETYTSTTASDNAVLISDDATVTMDNVTVTKTGDAETGDESSFYGNNSGILAKDNADVTISNSSVNTSATGANGVFSYGSSKINISASSIKTTGDSSGGIMVAGGGSITASNLNIETSGTSSAAIRSDKGGGSINVSKGTYKTTGVGSPSIYSTADITVKDATLEATSSEGVVIEGKNSVTLENVTLTDTNNKLNGQSTTYKNIFLYQSMSGDADTGTSKFTAKNSTITTNKGDTLYVTNTDAVITLENNKIINNDSTGNFLRIQKDSWGTTGQNGGSVTLTLKNQTVAGNIAVDSISTLSMELTDSSSFEGSINSSNEAKSITLKLSKNSKIKLTGDSYVTSLDDEDTSYKNIDFNGYKLYVNGKSVN